MAEQFVHSQIRNLPLFGQLTAPQIGVIAALTVVLRFEPGGLVVQEGQPTQGLFLFAGGRGILTRRSSSGMEDRVGTVEAGQYIDETALYDSGYENASLRIVETAIVLLIPRTAFVQMVTRYPEIRANLRIQSATDVAARQTGGKLFKGQRDDETVLHVWRRHWWAVARYGWIAIVVALALFAFALVLAERAPVLALGAAGLAVIIPGAIAMYLYFEWQNDSIVVSDQRIVRIWNQIIGFENTLSEIPLDRVIEVNVTIPPADPFARLFHYGTIFVRTAGEAANMTLEMLTEPQQVQSAIFTQRDRFRDRLEQRKRETVRDDVEQALGLAQSDQPQPVPLTKRSDHAATIGLPFVRTKFIAANGDIVYRKHSTVWMQHIMLPTLAVGASLVLMLISLLVPAFPLTGPIGLAAGMFLLIVSLIWFYAADWDWRNDLFIIGSDAITLIRKRPLWLQNESERIRISQIDNVKSRVDGLDQQHSEPGQRPNFVDRFRPQRRESHGLDLRSAGSTGGNLTPPLRDQERAPSQRRRTAAAGDQGLLADLSRIAARTAADSIRAAGDQPVGCDPAGEHLRPPRRARHADQRRPAAAHQRWQPPAAHPQTAPGSRVKANRINAKTQRVKTRRKEKLRKFFASFFSSLRLCVKDFPLMPTVGSPTARRIAV